MRCARSFRTTRPTSTTSTSADHPAAPELISGWLRDHGAAAARAVPVIARPACKEIEMLITDTAAMEWERLRVSSRNMRTSRKLLREGRGAARHGVVRAAGQAARGGRGSPRPARAQLRPDPHRPGDQMEFGPGLDAGREMSASSPGAPTTARKRSTARSTCCSSGAANGSPARRTSRRCGAVRAGALRARPVLLHRRRRRKARTGSRRCGSTCTAGRRLSGAALPVAHHDAPGQLRLA